MIYKRINKHIIIFNDQIMTFLNDKKYDWALLNMISFVNEEFKRSKKWTLLSTFIIKGYLL